MLTTYNAIVGRPILLEFYAIVCIWYLYIKMPSEAGLITVRGRQLGAQYYHFVSLVNNKEGEVLMSEVIEIEGNMAEQRTEPIGDLEAFAILEGHPDRCMHVNDHLEPHQKGKVREFLVNH